MNVPSDMLVESHVKAMLLPPPPVAATYILHPLLPFVLPHLGCHHHCSHRLSEASASSIRGQAAHFACRRGHRRTTRRPLPHQYPLLGRCLALHRLRHLSCHQNLTQGVH